jgi:hypothetical protein
MVNANSHDDENIAFKFHIFKNILLFHDLKYYYNMMHVLLPF